MARRAWSRSARSARAVTRQGRGRRRAARSGLFDEHVTGAEQDRARAAPRLTHPPTKIGQITIGIDNVAFGGLARYLIVSTVIQRNPKPTEALGTGDLRPPHGRRVARHRPRSTRGSANTSSTPRDRPAGPRQFDTSIMARLFGPEFPTRPALYFEHTFWAWANCPAGTPMLFPALMMASASPHFWLRARNSASRRATGAARAVHCAF